MLIINRNIGSTYRASYKPMQDCFSNPISEYWKQVMNTIALLPEYKNNEETYHDNVDNKP